MSIATELTALETNLANAKQAIVAKGGTVGSDGLAGLASEIETVPSGGGGEYGFISYYTGTTGDYTYSGYGYSSITIDATKLSAWFEAHGMDPSVSNIPFMSEYNSYWQCVEDGSDWYSYAQFEADTGISVVRDGDYTPVEFYVHYEQIPDPTSALASIPLGEGDVSALAVSGNNITIGETTLLKTQVASVTLSDEVKSLPNNFCHYMRNLKTVIMPSFTNIPSGFCVQCYALTQVIGIDNMETIGGGFLSACTSFNQPIDLSKVTSIGSRFLNGCKAFNQDLTIPSTCLSIGDGFMGDMKAMVGTITWNGALPTEEGDDPQWYTTLTSVSASPSYITGITIAGTQKNAIRSTYPDQYPDPMMGTPGRKLIITS